MKLISKLAIAVFACAFLFSSCSKNPCYDCVESTINDTQTLCEDDYPGGKALFESAIDTWELAGYTCTKK